MKKNTIILVVFLLALFFGTIASILFNPIMSLINLRNHSDYYAKNILIEYKDLNDVKISHSFDSGLKINITATVNKISRTNSTNTTEQKLTPTNNPNNNYSISGLNCIRSNDVLFIQVKAILDNSNAKSIIGEKVDLSCDITDLNEIKQIKYIEYNDRVTSVEQAMEEYKKNNFDSTYWLYKV